MNKNHFDENDEEEEEEVEASKRTTMKKTVLCFQCRSVRYVEICA